WTQNQTLQVFPSTTAVNNPSTSNSTASNISVLGRPHECFTCHKIFLTGQASGGHMRLHYKGVIDGGKKSNGGASGQSHCSNIVRDFDLNMPAFDCPEDSHEALDDQLLECDEDFDDHLRVTRMLMKFLMIRRLDATRILT
ncbi:zinc finger ZAT10-like, partial [Olea europaea subsp. europaea]